MAESTTDEAVDDREVGGPDEVPSTIPDGPSAPRVLLSRLRDVDPVRWVGGGLLALSVVALVVGAAVIGDTDGGSVEDPAAYVAGFFQEGDAAGFAEVLHPRTVEGIPDVEEALGPLMAQPQSAEEVGRFEVNGVEIVDVQTQDGNRWCVLPSGTILNFCNYGAVPADVTVTGAEVDTEIVFAGLLPDGGQVVTRVVNASAEEPLVLQGSVETEADGAWSLGQLFVETPQGAQPLPPDAADVEIPPGGALVLVALTEPGEEPPGPATLTATWGEVEVVLDLGAPELFLR